MARLQSIDLLRGAVMIVMALDHTRDFVHSAAGSFSPEDLSRTTAAIFFTRWITHFCAPVFMLTAGLGAFLRGDGKSGLSKFLLTRGLWLIFLELTVERFEFSFHFAGPLLLVILWALGWSMIALAGLVHLPIRVLAGVSIAMIATHNLADGITAKQFGAWAPVWNLLHQQSAFSIGGIVIVAAYPLIPWIGVMAAGYCLGQVFLFEESRRRRTLIRLGLGLTLGFIVMRTLNVYGDPVRWSEQSSPLFTVLSFLRCAKYPPSLDFLLMTLGPAIAILGWIDGVRVERRNPFLVFGRVPLFYFLVHLLLIHVIAMLLTLRHGTAGFLLDPPASVGISLLGTYTAWAAVVALMYPMSAWFADLKQRRHDWWLGYL
jgi:uncharacterized membrane protein